MSMMKYPADFDVDIARGINNWSGELNGSINASVTTITLVDVTGLSAPGLISIDNEIIAFKAVNVGLNQLAVFSVGAGDDFDGRGFDGSTASTHSDGATASRRICAFDTDITKEIVEVLEKVAGLYEEVALNPAQTGSFATVGTIFDLGTAHRSMVVEYEITRTFSDATEPIYESGVMRCIRYSTNDGDLDRDGVTIDGSGAVSDSNVLFQMNSGAGTTVLAYKVTSMPNTSAISFKARVRKVEV